MIHSKEINACFRNHLISSSFIISGHPYRMLFCVSFFAHGITHKMQLDMAVQIARIFAEIMYNSNNSNSNSYNASRYNTHNAYRHDIGNRLNEIVRVSSYPSINA